ncbi:MAG: hydrogenase subunit MbhD domain-containing protein, partial [Cyanobacteria bacterium P01_C01_bin.72]
RAILGAVAALVYATLGGADVALTEALVGTMLATTLYVVTVRSSLVMRLGVLNRQEIEQTDCFAEFLSSLKRGIAQHHLRLEIVDYDDSQALTTALMSQEVHAICQQPEKDDRQNEAAQNQQLDLNTAIRIRRLYDILQRELTSSPTTLEYVTVANSEEKH